MEEEEQEAERLPAGSLAAIELTAEDAEVIAQFIGQMIANGVVPDERVRERKKGRGMR